MRFGFAVPLISRVRPVNSDVDFTIQTRDSSQKMDIAEYRNHVAALLDRLRVAAAEPGQYAAHYTGAKTPIFLLQSAADNKMRQFDGDYMNDPEEGRYLVDVMIAAAQACRRAYIDGNPGLISNNSILYFGPKADHKQAIEVMGLAANLGVDLRVFVSSMPYR